MSLREPDTAGGERDGGDLIGGITEHLSDRPLLHFSKEGEAGGDIPLVMIGQHVRTGILSRELLKGSAARQVGNRLI